MAFTIREPRSDEASAIADLHVATWKEAYLALLPEDYFSEEYVAGRHRMWQHVLTHPRYDMIVRVAEPPRDRLLYAIYVLAAPYGTGVGQALLNETLGDGPAMLWVAKKNPPATAFDLREGFRCEGVEQVDPDAPLITDARMVR